MYVSDSYDPVQNIEGGARYLRHLANQYQGDMVKTLAAYNAGPEAVRRAGGAVPNIPETREYVRKVVALYNSFKAGR
jgi:soluble lytic murein transglycosylase-like protein